MSGKVKNTYLSARPCLWSFQTFAQHCGHSMLPQILETVSLLCTDCVNILIVHDKRLRAINSWPRKLVFCLLGMHRIDVNNFRTRSAVSFLEFNSNLEITFPTYRVCLHDSSNTISSEVHTNHHFLTSVPYMEQYIGCHWNSGQM